VFYASLEIASAFIRSAVWKLGNGVAYFCSVIFAIKVPNIYFPYLVTGVPVIEQPLVTGYWPAVFFAMITSVITSLGVAVASHRIILVDDIPKPVTSVFDSKPIVAIFSAL
jgi:hypothetical protein